MAWVASKYFGGQTLFKLEAQWSYFEVLQRGKEATSIHKLVNKCSENISDTRFKCANARSLVNKKN